MCQQNDFLLKILNLLHGEGQCQTRGLTKSDHPSSSGVIDILSVVGNLVQLSVIEKEVLEKNYMKFVVSWNSIHIKLIDKAYELHNGERTLEYFHSLICGLNNLPFLVQVVSQNIPMGHDKMCNIRVKMAAGLDKNC